MSASTLLPAAARLARQDEKQRLVLKFLREETWSRADVIAEVIGIRARSAVYMTLVRLESAGYLRRAHIAVEYGPDSTLWGITPHGLAFAFELNEPFSERQSFEPSKVAIATLAHTLDVQRMRVRAERAGWTDWERGDRGAYQIEGGKYPDARGRRPDGILVAIEIERTVKSVKRYGEILVSHLAARKAGYWSEIYYLSPNASLTARVRRAMSAVRRARYRGEHIQITDAHRAPFSFFSYDDDWLHPH